MKSGSGKLMAVAAGAAVFSLIFASPCFSDKDDNKKKKHEDVYSRHFEHEIKKEKDAFRNELKSKKDVIEKHGKYKADKAHHVFSRHEKDAILEYYSMKNQNMPPGLAKKVENGGSLPPGWHKKIARGQVVPSDIYRYAEPVPDDVLIRFPRPAAGTSLIKIDNRIVRVVDATKTIVDVIDIH